MLVGDKNLIAVVGAAAGRKNQKQRAAQNSCEWHQAEIGIHAGIFSAHFAEKPVQNGQNFVTKIYDPARAI
jgi:hypothetical protein